MRKKRKFIKGSTIARNYVEHMGKFDSSRGDYSFSTPIQPRYAGIDWGEPRCMGCGYYENAEYVDVREEEDNEKDWLNCWDRACECYLEKCHIVPHSQTGDDSPDNFILLCSKCHAANPNTSSVKMYQRWLDSIEPWSQWNSPDWQPSAEEQKVIEEGTAAMKVFDVSIDDMLDALNHKDFKEYYEKNTTQVAGGNNWNTRIAAIAGFLDEARA